ncbi:hypothetical protein HPB47_006129, partial [Ixodes persulcatus]
TDDVDELASSLQSEASASSTRSPKRKQFEDFVAEAKAAIWNFFFNVTENHKLPHSVATKIFGDLQLVFEHIIKAFADEIAAKVDVSALPPDVISLLECSFLPDLFKGIQSKHLREQYAKTNFPYVEPESCELDTEGGGYHYVPIPRLLRKLCEIPDIAAQLVTPQARHDETEVYRDFSDGLLFQDLKGLIPEGDHQGRVCRFCMATSGKLSKLTSEDFCLLRSAGAHQEHLKAITVNPKLNKRMYGVNERSPMLELPYFDVTRQLPPDLMHDILEGGFETVLRPVLKALVDDGILAYSDLDYITSFEYGQNDKKNKPVGMNRSFLTNKANLKGTASEKWCLLRLLSVILGNLVPEGNPDWELYLQFREIVDLSFATVIPSKYLPFLEI